MYPLYQVPSLITGFFLLVCVSTQYQTQEVVVIKLTLLNVTMKGMKYQVCVSKRNVTLFFIARREPCRTFAKVFVGIISDQPELMILLQHNVHRFG